MSIGRLPATGLAVHAAFFDPPWVELAPGLAGSEAWVLDPLAKARAIIDGTGYHRRDEELAGLEAEVLRISTAP